MKMVLTFVYVMVVLAAARGLWSLYLWLKNKKEDKTGKSRH